MKLINKKLFAYMMGIALVLAMASCTNDDVFEGPDGEIDFTTFGANFDKDGALILVSDVVNGFYDLADLNNASIGFTVDAIGDAVSSVDLNVAFRGQMQTLSSVSSFPSNVTVPLSDVLSALGVASSDVGVGEEFTFSFANVTTSGGAFSSGTSLAIPASCSSALGGVYDYVSTNLKAEFGYGCPAGEVTGQVTFEDLGGGKYLCSDLGFGQYGTSCWGDSPATSGSALFTDVCNGITSGGLDQYGLVYIWVITGVSGPNLSLSWSNNYGDSGDVVITRPDGTDWPALFSND